VIEEITEAEILNETEELKNETKEEVKPFEGAKTFTNTGPKFISPLPSEIVFDFDMGLGEYAYVSPVANDTEGDKIYMDFKGVEGIPFIVIRKK
jgi:hypothetical protein